MTFRQRFLETLLLGKPDKVPLQPGGGVDKRAIAKAMVDTFLVATIEYTETGL